MGRGHQRAPWLSGVGAGWKPAWAPGVLPSQRLQTGPGDPGAPSTPPPRCRGRSSATSLPQPLPACSVPPHLLSAPPAPSSGSVRCREGHGRGWMWPQQLGTPPSTVGLRPPHGTEPLSHHSTGPWYQGGRCRGLPVAPPGPLTADVQVVFGHDAAHGAGGRADVGAAVALVEEGEDEDAVGAELQRRVAALLLPQELLGAAGREGGVRHLRGPHSIPGGIGECPW